MLSQQIDIGFSQVLRYGNFGRYSAQQNDTGKSLRRPFRTRSTPTFRVQQIMIIQDVHIPEDKLDAFCRKWRIVQLAVFGSALRNDFGPESDLDLIVAFEPDARITLFDHMQIEDELEELVGRNVDLVTRRAVEQSYNWIRRKSILDSAKTIYEAG